GPRDPRDCTAALPSGDLATWDEIDAISAVAHWTAKHGQPPDWAQGLRLEPDHPHASTVFNRFGSWTAAIAAAGLDQLAERGWTIPSRPALAGGALADEATSG